MERALRTTHFVKAMVLSITVLLPVHFTAGVQTSNPEGEEVKAVFRISKAFFDDAVGRQEIVADIPFSGRVLGMDCSGVIHGTAIPAVDILENGQAAVFKVNASGTGSAQGNCFRGPLAVISPLWGPFRTETEVRFDGRTFSHGWTCAAVDLQGCLQEVRGRCNRRMGRLLGRGMTPLVRKLMPRAVAQAKPIADQHVQDFVENKAHEIIAILNKRSPVEASVNRILPETRNWVFQVSATRDYIQAAYGPPASAVPDFAQPAVTVNDLRVEAWLQSTGEEARALAELANSPLAKQLIDRYLEATLPELARLGNERVVTAEGKWVHIQIGNTESATVDSMDSE